MNVETPEIDRTTIAGTATIHRKPGLAPLYASLCLLIAFVLLMNLAGNDPRLERWLLQKASFSVGLHRAAIGIAVFLFALGVLDHFRRLRTPSLPGYVRINRALAYGIVGGLALFLELTSNSPSLVSAVMHERPSQLIAAATTLALSVAFYFTFLFPVVVEERRHRHSYKDEVARLRDTNDFVVGESFEDDWKLAEKGAGKWEILKERGLYANVLALGGIGSGKTATVIYPLLKQALRKFPNDDTRTPSIVLMDLKGDNALEVYNFCKEIGREDEFWCIRPGNTLVDGDGKDIIPRDRFLSWNPVGGSDAADIRAALLLEGLQAAGGGGDGGKHGDYFRNVEGEFLAATLTLMDAVNGPGFTTLKDLYLFGLSHEYRQQIINDKSAQGSTAQLYFKERFEKMKSDEQGNLISGLSSKLARMTTTSLVKTFCPQPGDGSTTFSSVHDIVVNKPGIIVFSVPEAMYSKELARLLGVVFLSKFHKQMLRRSDTSFRAAGGNSERLVMQFTDECWAYMNPGIASFTAVSRQARCCSVFASQSLDQIGRDYRDTIVGNFRSKIILPVNDELTLEKFSKLMGEHKEFFESQSTSQSLNDVHHKVLSQGVAGKNQGLTASTSYQERLVPRFSTTEIQHLPANRMLVHSYDGEAQQPAIAVRNTPHFLPEFAL